MTCGNEQEGGVSDVQVPAGIVGRQQSQRFAVSTLSRHQSGKCNDRFLCVKRRSQTDDHVT